MKAAKAVEDLISRILSSIGWAVAIIVLLITFRGSLKELLRAIAKAMEERAVTLEVSTVKMQVAERSLDVSGDRTPLFSRSPFELGADPVRVRYSILSDIAPQLVFHVSDYVAERWSKSAHEAAREMRQGREELAVACKRTPLMKEVKGALLEFSQKLETTRFLEASQFARLLSDHKNLGKEIDELQPKDLNANGDDFLILHCAGVAYAQADDWSKAKAILERIVWKNEGPYYLPAADVWLASVYGVYIEEAKSEAETDLESAGFFQRVEDFLKKGQQIYDSMANANWKTFPTQSDVGYYKRELSKVIGTIFSILGEYSKIPDRKANYFQTAAHCLTRCTQPIDGDLGSPLDHNNLADLYRQMGEYTAARTELCKVFENNEKPDPIFYHTLAQIFCEEKQPLEGLLALEQYGEAEAREANVHDVNQYIENQIFAAKLAVAVDPYNCAPYLALASSILERARRFVDLQRTCLGESTANKLQIEIEELLGLAYFQLPGYESRAAEAFERLSKFSDPNASEGAKWRRQLYRARALTRLACSQRRNFSAQVATQQRKLAHNELAQSEKTVKAFPVDDSIPIPRRSRHFRICLDTVVALQALAEESFFENEVKAADDLLTQENNILISLRGTLEKDSALQTSLGNDLVEIRTQTGLCEAQRCFLLGRILIQSDPLFSDTGLIDKVKANFNAARGVDKDLECLLDLELGQMLLSAALAGKGDVNSRYREAIISLEKAASGKYDVPALRLEAIKALADAYASRNAVLRKAKESPRPV